MGDQIVESKNELAIQPGHKQDATRKLRLRSPLQRILGRIPFTREFGIQIKESEERIYKEWLAEYYNLKSLDANLKAELASEFKANNRRLSYIESRIRALDFYRGFLTLVILIPLYFAAPLIARSFFPYLIGWHIDRSWGWVLELLVTVVIGVIASLVAFLPILFFDAVTFVSELFNSEKAIFLWLVVLLFAVVAYLSGLYVGRLAAWPWPFRHELVFSFLIQAAIIYPLMFAVIWPLRRFRTVIEVRKRKLLTRPVIIIELLEILRTIEEPNYDSLEESSLDLLDYFPNLPLSVWTDLSHRGSMTKRLERVASCLESYFPRHFITGVPDMDRWTNQSASEMANGVREVIKWVVLPKTNTLEQFKARVTKYFTAALSSEWDQFDRVPAEKLTRKQSLKNQVASAVAAVLTAAVPILLLLLLRRLGVVVAEPLVTYLTVGAYIWAALSLLSRLDPQYAAKLGALSDLSKILPLGKKGGDDV